MAYGEVPAGSGVHAIIGLTGLTTESGEFTLHQERVVRFAVPTAVDRRHAEMIRRDSELLAEIAGNYADELGSLHNAAVRGDFPTAGRIAREIGLTEERAVAEGGGMWGWIALAAIGIGIGILIQSEDDQAPGPPEPPPAPTEPPTDAGLPPGGAPG
jgi:hypothetical protein